MRHGCTYMRTKYISFSEMKIGCFTATYPLAKSKLKTYESIIRIRILLVLMWDCTLA